MIYKAFEDTRHNKIILYFISFIISIIPALFYTAPAFEDGLGTMATAAYLSGHDWSSFLAEDGYYYKYGQALWYVIPFMLIDNAVVRYKVMLVINTILTAFIPVIAYHITLKYKLANNEDAFGISMLTGLLPSILLYNKYTWAETNLFIIPWLILLLQAQIYMENKLSPGRQRIYSAAIGALAVYAFMSHQRGLVVVIATTMILLLMKLCKKKGICIFPYIAVLVLGLCLDRIVSCWQKENVYAGAVLMHNTLADFLKPEVYSKIFSIKGAEAIIKSFIGWLYNFTCSTFGIGLAGLLFMLVLSLKCIMKRKFESARDIMAVQGLLCFLGAFALGLLFFFQSSYGYFDGTQVERSDHLLFGRYLESSYPILFYFGLIGMGHLEVENKIKNISFAMHIGMLGFVDVLLLPLMENVNCYVHSLMSMNLFMDTSNVTKTLDTIPNYVTALFLFGIVSVIIALLFRLIYSRSKNAAYILVGCLFLCIYIWNSITVTGRIDSLSETKYAQYYLNH